MYQLHLIRKYLVNRRIAWVALVAVMLCTAMVLVVISVMGGWLKTFKSSFRGMTGDIVVVNPSLNGFPYYDQMIDGIRKLPGVAGATPIVRTFGLLSNQSGGVEYVQVLGYRHDVGDAVDWPATLYRQNEAKAKLLAAATTAPANQKQPLLDQAAKFPNFDLLPDVRYKRLVPEKGSDLAMNRPGIVVSQPIFGISHDMTDAQAAPVRWSMYRQPLTLTILPITGDSRPEAKDAVSVPCWIVDDSKPRLWQVDANSIYMSFEAAQRYLKLAPEGEPPRCSEIQIKLVPGTDLAATKAKVEAVVYDVRHRLDQLGDSSVHVNTWEELQTDFIHAVENEVVLTTALFGLMSFVAVLLVFCIFYMIVLEKTKDIGILKSIGATGTGILTLFLGYGLAIGTVGAGLGFTIAFFFVKYINELHEGLAKLMGGKKLFDPKTYQFDRIPSSMEPRVVTWVVVVAIASAFFGALLPALKAATMNPVDSLRYE